MPHYKFDQIAFNITDKKMPEPGDEKMYIGLEHLDSGSLKITRWGSEVELTGQKLVMRKGDVLFGRRNTYLRRAAIAPHDGIFSAHGMIFRPKTQVIDPEYFPFFISSNYFMDAAIRISVGSLSPTVNWKTLKELEFDLPSLEEQRKNAALLKSINETKEAYQELLIQTDNLVKSQFIEMFGDPFENPKGYEKKTIGDVCDFQGGSQPPRKEFIFKPQEGYVRLIQIRDYKTDDYITYAPEKMCRRFCDADDIMIGRYGPPIFQILQGIEGAYNVALMKAIPHGINKEFMRAYLKRDELLHHLELFSTRTAGQSGIEMSELRGYPCLVPPEEEQLQYVEFVHQSDKSKFELKEAIKSCDALMKAILFTNLEEKEG